jgi:hypothetical protein
MPLKPGKSQATISKNISEFHTGKTYAHTAAKFGKARANAQAIAAALNEAGKSNRADGGPIGVAPGDAALGIAHIAPPRASGGALNKIPRTTINGPIVSTVPGRKDHHAGKVPSGSYVIPADIVSGHGQGNTLAGLDTLQKKFKMGPYGVKSPRIVMGTRKPHLMQDGGGVTDPDNMVDVNLSGGELVVPPENLMGYFGPDLKKAHEKADAWVLQQRKKLRKTLANLPGPVKRGDR